MGGIWCEQCTNMYKRSFRLRSKVFYTYNLYTVRTNSPHTNGKSIVNRMREEDALLLRHSRIAHLWNKWRENISGRSCWGGKKPWASVYKILWSAYEPFRAFEGLERLWNLGILIGNTIICRIYIIVKGKKLNTHWLNL